MATAGEPFGPWSLTGLIAVGGVGEIWRAVSVEDPARGEVAVKRLHTHLMRHEEARVLFAQEQELTCSLPAHPGLAKGTARGAVDGRPWLALPVIGAGDLRPHIAKVATPMRPCVEVLQQLCLAVAHLHTLGWAHGDVCPGNVLVDGGGLGAPDARVVLCDLGVARRLGKAGPVRGTHAYMAPEQVRGEAWTAATDVFALAVLGWELAAGRRLFHRGPTWLTMAAVVEAEIPAVLPAELDRVLRAALDRDATRRTPTPRALHDQLDVLLRT